MWEVIEKEIISLLENALIAWRTKQTKARGNVSLNAFAEDLGASRSLVSMWMLGERPMTIAYREKVAKPIADLVGSHAYEILGVTPPNPYLQKINQLFAHLSPEHQLKLAQDAERYRVKNNANAEKNHKNKKPPDNK